MRAYYPTQDPTLAEREAAAAVESLRVAIRHGDAEAAQAWRWLAPRPPGERDLLSDLSAAEGLGVAIRRLSRFWRRAEVRLERVRSIGTLEAEVYEQLVLPDESLSIVSLVRRADPRAGWRVVCTNEAHDERLRVWIPATRPLDARTWAKAFAARFGDSSELAMDGRAGVLSDVSGGWLAHVRGPRWPSTCPPELAGEAGVVELSTLLVPPADGRWEQLAWLVRCIAVSADRLGAELAHLPALGRTLDRGVLEAACGDALKPLQRLRLWTQIEEVEGHILSHGLRVLGLPEVEAETGLLDSPELTARMVEWFGAKLVETRAPDSLLGREVAVGQRTLRTVPGRRGPRRGRSYGRWGALRLEPKAEAGG